MTSKDNLRQSDSSMPRWFELRVEIDHAYYRLEEICKQIAYRKPIEQMVDEATGYDTEMDSEAAYWASEIKRLRQEYDNLPETLLNQNTDGGDNLPMSPNLTNKEN